MLVTIGIAQNFENFQNMCFTQAFVVAPAHCGQLAVQGGVSAEFGAKGVVGNIKHGGEFFGRIEHAEEFLGDVWELGGFHGTFKNLRKLMRNNRGFACTLRSTRGIILNDFGTFRNDFKLGANDAGIFSIDAGFFLNGAGTFSRIFLKNRYSGKVAQKSLSFLSCGVICRM
jgi:hypothetical protein